MTHQEIKELAGHREIPPWVIKLVGDAVQREREACAKLCELAGDDEFYTGKQYAENIRIERTRGEAQ